MEFDPPIETRETDELIIISKSSADEYQTGAIELAKKELANRNISNMDIDQRYRQLAKEHEEITQQIQSEMAEEDYNVFEKLWIIFFWPREIFHGWFLRSEGYVKKASNRIKLILIGIALYAIIILLST